MGFSKGGTGEFDVDKMWQGAMTGLAQGTFSVALEWAGQELGIDPLTSSLIFNTATGAIEGLFGLPQYDPVTNTYNRPNSIFEGVFNNYKNSILSAIGVGANDPWQKAVYISQILDFAQITKDQGIVQALETYASGIFQASAINSMVNIAGSVGNYFREKIENNLYCEQDDGGIVTRIYDVEDEGYLSTSFDEYGKEFIKELSFYDNTLTGEFGLDPYGKFGLLDGVFQTPTYYGEVSNGDLLYLMSKAESGRRTTFMPSDGSLYQLSWGESGIIDGTYIDYDLGTTMKVSNGNIIDVKYNTDMQNVSSFAETITNTLIDGYTGWQDFKSGVNAGALGTFLSRDYIDLNDTNATWHGLPVASSLANAIDGGLQNFLTERYNANTETLSRYIGFLGDTGTIITDLYSDWLMINNAIATTVVMYVVRPFWTDLPNLSLHF